MGNLAKRWKMFNTKQVTIRDKKIGNFLNISEQSVFAVLYGLYNHCYVELNEMRKGAI
ncbi:MAG: hypothetical protein AMXMBFR17_29810 [Candidatus Jettenia caeni]|nr:MAG: hypothetical protein JETCAE04_32980 [Candidatus Jettenia caeni]